MNLNIYGEEALDLFADLLEPATAIIGDKEVAEAARAKNLPRAVKLAIKGHKQEVIEILAALNGEAPEEYAKGMTVLTLPVELLKLLNDPMVQNLFQSQGQRTEEGSSGSATVNTEESGN